MDWTSVQLRSLVELQRRGTVTAVSEALGYTPGGVSQQLAALERATGMPLLRRVGRRVELTDAGVVLAAHARHILDVEADAVAALERDAGEIAGTLRIALFASAATILPVMLARTAELHPRLDLRCQEMDVDDVYDVVSSQTFDVAVGLDYPEVPIRRDPQLQVVRLLRERFAVAAPLGTLPAHEPFSLTRTEGPGWILAYERTHYGQAFRAALRRAGVEPQVRYEVTDTAATLALVEAGVGIAPVTDLMLRLRPARVAVLPLVEPVERDVVAVIRKTARSRPSVAALLDVLTGAAAA
ncbi:LysR family transcriptional regulator [Pseudonocardia oroxyli]|uniref:Transcriptional regulator, LysR family n=1 Tax=Pseudonocardia oroxyli TaxID=366584 RepID=A0A1G7ST88_PSEOR|nr:LysR family transcriptional regulator [Pseudonocardia oroxyli]SDG26181.1 transcriptional regulator, LysR family [Pseudonocardia oroxyli]